jgi:hypothetical protein
MRKFFTRAEPHRLREAFGPYPGTKTGNLYGIFIFLSNKTNIKCIVCDSEAGGPNEGWEHVSVSASAMVDDIVQPVTPTWEQMCIVKDLFWEEEECVIQYHPPRSEYVNIATNCLHLWKNVKQEVPRPPQILV